MKFPNTNGDSARFDAFSWPAAVLLVVAILGCGPCPGASESDQTDDSADPIAMQYAESVLPFPVDPGVERMRQLFRMPTLADLTINEDEPGLLIGVAAAPDYAAVAFPAGDRVGYDIAFASARQPWDRVELNDLAVEDVGAVAAAQSRDGEVWFAFRARKAPHAIDLWRWRRGEEPLQVPFARTEPAAFPEHSESCPDIDIAIADGGEVDLVFRQSHAEVRHARLEPGSSTWDQVVINSPEEVPAGQDVGCSMRVEHDEGGVPNVLGWYRDASTEGVETIPRDTINGRGTGWFRTVTGSWLPTRWAYGSGASPRAFGVQGVDMVRVENGYLAIGSTFFPDAEPVGAPPNVVSTSGRPWLVPTAIGLDPKRCTDSYPLAGVPSYGLALMRRGEDAVTSFHPSEWRIRRMTQCKPHTDLRVPKRFAPVRQPQLMVDLRSPTAANGTRPYDLVVCINPDGQLVVCAGGITPRTTVSDRPIYAIRNGWNDALVVDPGVNTFLLDIVQETGDASPPPIQIERVAGSSGGSSGFDGGLITPPVRQGGEWQVSFTVAAGETYRISVGSPFDRDDWLREEGLGSVYVHGDIPRFDPREPQHHPCAEEGPIDERGVCTEPRQDLRITGDVDLPLFVDMTQGFERPQLYDDAGELVPTDIVTDEISGLEQWVELVPRDDLQQLSRYEVRFPEGTTNMFGAPYTADQLNWFVQTKQGPLTVVETEPANGAVDVPIDTTIRVTFSGPVAFYNDGNDFILEQQVGMDVSRVPVTFRERPGYVFEIEPDTLVPSATYTLMLTDGLRALEDGLLTPLVDAPVTVVFDTVAQ